jgi:hypothetical protein
MRFKGFYIASTLTLLVGVILVISILSAATIAQGDQSNDAWYYRQKGIEAFTAKDYRLFLDSFKRAVALRPDHPTFIYNLAIAYALNGDKQQALSWLSKVADMGLVYSADKDPNFDSIKDSNEFGSIIERFKRNKTPLIRSQKAFSLPEKGLVTEGMAYDPTTKTFYVGSVRQRKILAVRQDGSVSNFATQRDGLWSVLGMQVDAKRRLLWACSTATPQMDNFLKDQEGSSAVLKFNVATGRLIKKYELPPASSGHWFGKILVTSRGDVFVNDTVEKAIYMIDARSDELKPLLKGPFRSPETIAPSPDEKTLFIADYSKGIFVFDVGTRKYFQLPALTGQTLLGIDGLYFYHDSLIAVQNGVNPQRVVRIYLNKNLSEAQRLEVLEANNPVFDEPTLGVLVKDDFYFVANSQWGATDKNGQIKSIEDLAEPTILKLKL